MQATNHQRKGVSSNAEAGRNFEASIQSFWQQQGVQLIPSHPILIGAHQKKKQHRFDLGSNNPKILVECKSHRWTEGNNIPSAKLTVWNEAMYYFSLCPPEYRKLFCVLRDHSTKRNMTLAQYYIQTYGHLIPQGVEFWEFCEDKAIAVQLYEAA